MRKLLSSFLSTDKMDPGTKGILLAFGVYIVTIGIAVLIISIAIMFLSGTNSCKTMGQALVFLWVVIAVLFLASAVTVGVITWKNQLSVAGRATIVALYGAALLVSYIVLAFGLLVAFNC